MTDTNPRDLIERLAYELDAETGYTNHRTGERITHIDVAEARAYLAQPEPEELTDDEIEKRFQRWWFNEGSGMRPFNGEDQEEHTRRVSQIAWSNGAYVARWSRPDVEPEPEYPSDQELLESND